MSAEPVWCLFQVKPDDSSIVQQAFETAVGRSDIAATLQKYLQRRERHARLLKKQLDDFPFFGNSQGVALADYVNDAQLFLDGVGDVFFLRGVNELFSILGKASTRKQDSMIEMVVTHRIAATQMLYGALGWQIGNRLPGHFGNMFIPPQEVSTTLTAVEAIFNEINIEEFFERACAIGGSGVGNGDKVDGLLTLLPSTLKLVLKKGCGLAAISYPHLGSLSFSGNEEYEDDY